MRQLQYVPELDGLRAVAVILVVLFHAAPNGPLSGGFVGVDLFFVLSAFLISSVLVEDPSLPRFYWHRFCRLMPALLFMLAGYLLVGPFVWPRYHHLSDATLAALYLSDYSYALYRVPLFLQHTWSLAVEEHFYLLWPFVLPMLVKSRYRLPILVFAYVAMTAWRFAWDWHQYYYRFDTHATGLILGAIVFFARPRLSAASAYAALALLGVIALTANIGHSRIPITLAELCGAILIAAPPAWLSNLRWLGRRSYAIYLWHFPIAYAVRAELGFWITAILTLGASTALAALSWNTVEAWGRGMRENFFGAGRSLRIVH